MNVFSAYYLNDFIKKVENYKKQMSTKNLENVENLQNLLRKHEKSALSRVSTSDCRKALEKFIKSFQMVSKVVLIIFDWIHSFTGSENFHSFDNLHCLLTLFTDLTEKIY